MKHGKFDLTGKTALITGAAGLLGTEHAAALLACGARVVLTDISDSALAAERDRLAVDFDSDFIMLRRMDVASQQEVTTVASSLAANGLRVDVLINNAAIDPKVKEEVGIVESSRLENFPLDQWNLQLAVGLTGAFLCSQVFGKAMAQDGKGGVILNIASDLSVFSPDQRLYRKPGLPEEMQPVKPVTYSVIKAGLVGLTRYLATYWPDRGVRANALSPGGVFNGQGEEFVQHLSALIPLGRMAGRDEYRSAVQFLCSDASSYMNGQNIVMDGGRSVW
ncbi:MAG: SDR family oxidoreductase [Gammaproteobacteria bacterium]|nr:SDR family oxidoreductase [Gammaproteobacteria bacterium]MBU0788305.1 SDR family oxidoreductase [Gammaproteobacteria bacterium]MBU0815198.1 SDR family oxidoreductase [Gammaproteobacteria bacterium]MBU1785694.1 SDR family oxidoreductase [Gammaproteobacteria bacterium]